MGQIAQEQTSQAAVAQLLGHFAAELVLPGSRPLRRGLQVPNDAASCTVALLAAGCACGETSRTIGCEGVDCGAGMCILHKVFCVQAVYVVASDSSVGSHAQVVARVLRELAAQMVLGRRRRMRPSTIT